jgi:hypothetical protein
MTRYIEAHKDAYGVEPICQVLERSHDPPTTPPPLGGWSARQQRDAELKVEIERVHQENFGVYGVEKVWRQLHREGVQVGRERVARLMRELGAYSAQPRSGSAVVLPGAGGGRGAEGRPLRAQAHDGDHCSESIEGLETGGHPARPRAPMGTSCRGSILGLPTSSARLSGGPLDPGAKTTATRLRGNEPARIVGGR